MAALLQMDSRAEEGCRGATAQQISLFDSAALLQF
jgi:hypothetical protein